MKKYFIPLLSLIALLPFSASAVSSYLPTAFNILTKNKELPVKIINFFNAI